uniref:NADH dehydrogenase subunit 2 n=1 Tax=Basiprionota bisignata TaxID=2873934 RepID=UPI001F1495CF|nr:NADH dehydrogenase subunit 2 [Basiprionota bisignata]UKS07049.1 NADH dehydrogenase subunit 2 [Basiprionota bisignata]
MIKFYKLMFFNSLIIGTLISVCSYSWMIMWIGMEINLLSIIPMIMTKNIYSNESGMKYFIVQSMASTMFIFSVIMLEKSLSLSFQYLENLMFTVLQSSLLMKLGMAPFYSWFPEVIEGLTWMNCILMLTWQKIAPMVILMLTLKLTVILTISIIISALMSSILGLNQMSLRKILSYSSINHMAWMLLSMFSFSSIWVIYFVIYSSSNLLLMSYFSYFKIFFINQLNLLTKKYDKWMILFNFISLSGLPPLIGFFPKWLTISYSVIFNNYIITLILIMSSLVSMYFYMRITFSSLILITNQPKMKNFHVLKINLLLYLVNFIFILSLPIMNLAL